MNDDFENQLARRSLRAAPTDLRAQVLTAANSAPWTPNRPANSASAKATFWRWLTSQSPAWPALATVWLLCLSVNYLSGSGGDRTTRGSLAPEQLAAARAQRAELLQLAGLGDAELTDPPAAKPPRNTPPRPHSSLRRSSRPGYG